MASPLPRGKQPVNLATPVRVSRIRRDPPPVVKASAVRYRGEPDKAVVVTGIAVFGLALVIAMVGLGSVSDWSLGQYVIHIED